MKKIWGIIAGFLIAGTGIASADDAAIDMPQVSPTPSKDSDNEESTIRATNPAEGHDFQGQVLSNPMISDIGRAQSITGGGGNTAVVVQRGNSNRSSVSQTGNNNTASHTQTGDNNDISVNQQGEDNTSVENQTGNNNHKTIIQNGHERGDDSADDAGDYKDEEDSKENEDDKDSGDK